MPAKFGLPAIVVAVVFAVAAPVVADDVPSETTAPETTTATTTSVVNSPGADAPAVVTGPATVTGAGPTRGPQIQLTPPPPGPFDPPADGGTGRRVVYSKSQQTVWVYDETDTIINAHRVSGRQDPGHPTPGVYQVWSRSITTFAIQNPSITWSYMVRRQRRQRRQHRVPRHPIPVRPARPDHRSAR